MLDVNSFAPGVFLSPYIEQIAEMDEVKKTETGVGRREVRINRSVPIGICEAIIYVGTAFRYVSKSRSFSGNL